MDWICGSVDRYVCELETALSLVKSELSASHSQCCDTSQQVFFCLVFANIEEQ